MSLRTALRESAARSAARAQPWVDRALGYPTGSHLDERALVLLEPLAGPFVPWTRMAMRPSAVLTLVNDTRLNARRTVVECGAGVSTIYFARLLRELGKGHVHAIDDDAGWLGMVEEQLAAEDLSDHVTLVHAALEDGWYDRAATGEIPAGIDLLVVDGPQAYDRPGARYPALPEFAGRLAERCTIVLDDAGRRGEQAVAECWSREFGLSFDVRIDDGGIALAQRGAAFSVTG